MASTSPTRAGNAFASADSPRDLREALTAFFRYPSPLILLAAFLGSLAVRAHLGGWSAWDALAIAAPCLLWPFLEWTLHRYVLHLRPFSLAGLRVDFDFARKHRAHHREPWIPELIFLPPYLHLLLAPLLVALAFALLPPGLAASVLMGLFGITLVYEWTHFIVHTRIQPKSRFAQRIFRNHRMHHFRNENYWYSFTVPAIDRAFGTGPEHARVPRSDTVRTLGVTEERESG